MIHSKTYLMARGARLLAVLLLVVTVARGDGEGGALQQQAYLAEVQADLARQSGQTAEAVRQYRLAEEAYLELQRARPDWSPAIVAQRLTGVRNALAALSVPPPADDVSAQQPDAEPAAARGDGLSLEALQRLSRLSRELESLESESRTLRARNQGLAEELERSRNETAALSRKLDEEQQQRTGLEAQLETLQRQRLALEESLAYALPSSGNRRRLYGLLESLKTSLKNNERVLEKLQRDYDRLAKTSLLPQGVSQKAEDRLGRLEELEKAHEQSQQDMEEATRMLERFESGDGVDF